MTIISLTNITLFTALALSSIAAWYSILGLTAIFAAATIPIIIMGSVLEISKVVTTVWLHRYWTQIKWSMKIYLVIAVFGLALLTSIGVFGFLSKAHIDQGIPTGDVSAKIALIDERIKIQKENITVARTALAQMDSQVNARLERGSGEQSAERAVQIRRQQQPERNKLLKEINDAQSVITKLNEERAPIAAEFRKVEAEVGPIKYIAALLYDEESSKDSLERAVRWLILLIVFVFDPLALTLVLAANASRVWDKENKSVETQVIPEPIAPVQELQENTVTNQPETKQPIEQPAEIKSYDEQEMEKFDITQHTYLLKPYKHFPPNQPQIPNPPISSDLPNNMVEETQTPDTSPITTKNDKLYIELPGGYVTFQGKHMAMSALQQMHPELFLVPDLPKKDSIIDFGIGFPKSPQKNDTHLRTDMIPNRVFTYNGIEWVEMDKSQIDPETYDEKYIQHLINKIEVGDYNVQLLSEKEKSQIEHYLKNKA